ncbi:MAG TPA: AraC family transcriptional regulator [Solirubrobacteraceae bacterium]|nr:AraC family transcriptional regulator [Solirubrobacteraceae bacterium]
MEGLGPEHAHAHDFLVLAYFERGGGTLRIGQGEWSVTAGDCYLVAPGEVVGVGQDPHRLARARGWTVYFAPEGLGPHTPQNLLGWRAHPLLLAFARGASTGAQRLRVPPDRRRWWSSHLSELDHELQHRHDGYHEAAVANLTLLLVDLARFARDVVDDLKVNNEPLLAEVFAFIDAHYHRPISLRHVASALGLTPGHLTTVVRRKTGRTVQSWILERRMAEARRMLVETDQTVAEIGRSLGYGDPVYFSRTFRQANGTAPLNWRRAARG